MIPTMSQFKNFIQRLMATKGTATALGLSKLYTGTGSAVDGSMTQAAITTQLNTKANLASPALTGTPTAPTAAAGTNSTQIATTAFVHAAKNAFGTATAPSSLSTVKTVTIPGFVLQQGAIIAVRNTGYAWGLNPAINVNGTGAKMIMYRNHRMSPAYWKRWSTHILVYDDPYWRVVGDLAFNAVDMCGNVWIPSQSPFLASDFGAIESAVTCYESASLQMADTVTLGGSDFTIDFWSYVFDYQISSNVKVMCAHKDASNRFHLYMGWNADSDPTQWLGWQYYHNGQLVFSEDFNDDDYTGMEQFMHHAFVYKHSEGKVYIFRNGVLRKTFNQTLPAKDYQITVGNDNQRYIGACSCAIDQFRISNCVRWTENFTPATEPYFPDNNTVALCRFD